MITPEEAGLLRTAMLALSAKTGSSGCSIDLIKKLGRIAEPSAQALARNKASEQLEHAAISLGETVCASGSTTGEIRSAVSKVEKAAIDYHIACCRTGDGK